MSGFETLGWAFSWINWSAKPDGHIGFDSKSGAAAPGKQPGKQDLGKGLGLGLGIGFFFFFLGIGFGLGLGSGLA